MFKTYILGIVLGVAAAITGAYFLPVVDQAREASVITVTPNGGSSETFHINIPMDRIVVGTADTDRSLPPGVAWPDELTPVKADMYKLRNVHDAVVGVASRVVISNAEQGDAIEWVLHLPARGSLFVGMQTQVAAGTDRSGVLIRGTREFSSLTGSMQERWIANSGGDESLRGRIQLDSRFQSGGEL